MYFQWKWTRPLEDVETRERECATFECELFVTDVIVVWKVKGEEIEASPKFNFKANGKIHTLVVSKCRPKDEGTISCEYGKLKTEAKLFVERKYNNYLPK